jgi:hypothetical protein
MKHFAFRLLVWVIVSAAVVVMYTADMARSIRRSWQYTARRIG